jgi:protein O-GlcNAc transferase
MFSELLESRRMPEKREGPPQDQNATDMVLHDKYKQGLVLHQQGKVADAAIIYLDVLRQQPDHFDALHLLGLISLQTKNPKIAVELITRAIEVNANFAAAHNNLGAALLELKRPREALASCEKAIGLMPDYAEAYNNKGNALRDLNQPATAIASYDKAIDLRPSYAEAYYNRGNALLDLRRFADVLVNCDRAIELRPDLAEAYTNQGKALRSLKRPEEALASCDRAIALKPDDAEAHNCRGNALRDLSRPADALASYDRAIALKPGYAEAHNNRGNALRELKRPAEGLASYDRALSLAPDLAEAHNNRGNALLDLKRAAEALASYDSAIALAPDSPGSHSNRGCALLALKRPAEALTSYDKAIALGPDNAEAWFGRAAVLSDLSHHEEAAAAYAKALLLEPDFPFAKGSMLHQKMLCCDWSGVAVLIAEIENEVASGKMSAEPFGWLSVAGSERSLFACATTFNEKKYASGIPHVGSISRDTKRKIRIGYVSGEFREQATSHLLVGVLEEHDQTQFEVFAFDNGWDDGSEIRQRINSSVLDVVPTSQLSDFLTAAAIRENGIDILINLNGYFGEQRTQIFAQQPAPIQINFLGYPGTMGANYMQYIIADQQVIPQYNRDFYSEKIIYLPNTYQANDRKKRIGAAVPNRLESGLPESGFVFCCFNKNYKITPEIFDTWMRILKRVEGSVLWLLEDNATAANNLRKEAWARGISGARLVFAQRASLPDHLARHRLADLFLDTLPCNAHTTASDALWTGLPVLTCLGQTFAGRVAASLLSAIDVPQLITTNLGAYESMAMRLAMHPEQLALIRRKLAENRLTKPLFDTKLFTKHIEMAYTTTYERYHKGLMPDHITIPN